MITVVLTKSPIGQKPNLKRTLAALGLKKIRQEKQLPDNPAVRGMISAVKHCLTVTEG